MSQQNVGDIMLCSFNAAPRDWMPCEGQLLLIEDYQALYQIIGTMYGGDGETTFGLPDLPGCVPLGMGAGFKLGARGGEETHSLSVEELPAHTHTAKATNLPPNQPGPEGHYWAQAPLSNAYTSAAPNSQCHPAAISAAGNGQGHDNMPPFLALRFLIAVFGAFPSCV